jgi:predicted regulator of Ras-like GTPase activity (Roadblock/LC7/MglB family)
VAQLLNLASVTQDHRGDPCGDLFATSISKGSTLAVVAQRQCDMDLLAYEMTMLASRVRHALTLAPASE